MKEIKEALLRLDALANKFEAKNTQVSEASVGWHIAHGHLVVQSIVAALGASNPADYKWAFNIKRMGVLLVGALPRGKAKAPARVQPLNEITPEILAAASEKTAAALQRLTELPAKAHFKHPFFGVLHKNHSLRTMTIHTNHHIRIINDILKANA
jgi:hypothetical protein